MQPFLYGLGTVMVLYGLGVIAIIGTGSWFNFFYLFAGFAAVCCGMCVKTIMSLDRRLLTVIGSILLILLVLFLAFETAAVVASFKAPPSGAEYVVLLGCQVRDNGPSRDLYARIRAAAEYLKRNPDCKAVVTGGQGENEPMTEAEAAKRELIRLGIEEERIIKEEKSTSTRENLLFAMDMIKEDGGDPASDSVVIVSADYHVFRAVYTARKLGYGSVSGKGGTGLVFLLPHCYTREFAAFVKELFS